MCTFLRAPEYREQIRNQNKLKWIIENTHSLFLYFYHMTTRHQGTRSYATNYDLQEVYANIISKSSPKYAYYKFPSFLQVAPQRFVQLNVTKIDGFRWGRMRYGADYQSRDKLQCTPHTSICLA